MEFTPELLAGAVGVIVSLFFSYVPKVNVWFGGLSSQYKSLVMLLLMAVTAAIAFGLACWGVLTELTGINLACDRAGLIGLIRVFFVALMANQTTYLVSYQTEAVRAAKDNR